MFTLHKLCILGKILFVSSWTATSRSPLKLDSPYGYVTVYSRRHINGCKHTSTNQNNCSCPKHLYAVPKDKSLQPTPPQFAAKTNSLQRGDRQGPGTARFLAPGRAGSRQDEGRT